MSISDQHPSNRPFTSAVRPVKDSSIIATGGWVHWYNHRRLFGPLGHVPPAEFEAHYDHQLQESAMAA